MKNNLLHERTCRRFSTILLCGLLSLGAATAVAQSPQGQSQRTIKGTVVDEAGDPIPGANVIVQGTSRGVVSDIAGQFRIPASDTDSIEVTFVGYGKEVVSAGRDNVTVTLAPTSEQLHEVVVTALGIKREKKALGYAMQEVPVGSLTENKSVSLTNMLQGKIAGVQINQSGSGMGGSTRVVLRGMNSLSGNNQPLWVVDGIPINNDGGGGIEDQYGGTDMASAASQINPEDIESISVLKGANAAALYGSRAQNGAIIITTKKGKHGQPLSLEYNGNVQWTTVYNSYDYQNVYGQGSGGVFNTASKGSWGPRMEGQMVDHWRKVFYGDTSFGSQYALLPQDDYIKDFYDTGLMYSNSITATAGRDNMTGRLSFTDSRNNGNVPEHEINRQYFDLNTEFRNDFLTVGVKANYMTENVENAPAQGSYGLMWQFISMPRGIRLSDLATNNILSTGKVMNWSGPAENFSNPYKFIMSENGNETKRNRLLGNINATLKLTSYLSLSGRVGIDWYNDQYRMYALNVADGGSAATEYIHNETTHKDFTADVMLNFNKTFNDFSVVAYHLVGLGQWQPVVAYQDAALCVALVSLGCNDVAIVATLVHNNRCNRCAAERVALHASAQFDTLGAVETPVKSYVPLPVLGLDGRACNLQFHTLAAHLAGIYHLQCVTRRYGRVDGQNLVGGVAAVICEVDAQAVLEHAPLETGFPRIGAFGLQVGKRQCARQLHFKHFSAVDVAHVLAVSVCKLVSIGVVTYLCPRPAHFQVVNPVGHTEHFRNNSAQAHRRIEI